MVMMPKAQLATVPWAKIVDYLLSRTHLSGSQKAAFFRQFGFDEQKPEILMAALIARAGAHMVTREQQTPYGMKYEVSGPMVTPSGKMPIVKTVWIVVGSGPPRLVSAMPGKVAKR